KRKQCTINPLIKIPCKFHANTMEDVKILKVLYDHICFSNRTEDKYNLTQEIRKCEFCKHLKSYLRVIFTYKTIKCYTLSPYSACMEYNDHLSKIINLSELSSLLCENDEDVSQCLSYSKVEEPHKEEISSGVRVGELLSRMQDAGPQGFPEIVEGSNLADKNVIGDINTLGISCSLFFLYK
ncbi:PIR protein, partial [Plasmodium ovale]